MYHGLNYTIEQVVKEKGIPKETLIDAIQEAILSASKKKFGNHLDLEARYNDELDEVEVFHGAGEIMREHRFLHILIPPPKVAFVSH